ncbi:MAG: histidine phosphatase family protein [Sandaracinaceae bacterium]|nr:histidine phosphatase family protein [Sandaracinaceae bacterium]
MNRRLIIMRHAKSAWHTDAATDHDRPLNERGQRDAPRVASALAELGWSPELTVSSDSTRTRQTFELMRPAFRGPVTVRFTRRLYHASLDAVRDELADVGDALRTVMVIGHNPGWEEMLARLCGQDRRMTTANAALLTIDAPSWSDALDRYAWTLTRLLRPKEL